MKNLQKTINVRVQISILGGKNSNENELTCSKTSLKDWKIQLLKLINVRSQIRAYGWEKYCKLIKLRRTFIWNPKVTKLMNQLFTYFFNKNSNSGLMCTISASPINNTSQTCYLGGNGTCWNNQYSFRSTSPCKWFAIIVLKHFKLFQNHLKTVQRYQNIHKKSEMTYFYH